MARGGRRQGTPGTPYGNRADLRQPIKVISGQQYGERAALENAQRAIPLPNNAAVPTTAPSTQNPAGAASAPGPPIAPGAVDFARPTENPAEPVTAGLPTGPGPGPEIVNSAGPDTIGATLRAIFAMAPNDDLARVIALHDAGR